MSASASRKPAAEKKEASGQKPQLTKRTKRETVSDDDPFELERQKQSEKVTPLLRKPVKGKMFRVVCPMCDTPGFASPKIVGKEVKCRNPECLAPVFLVPDPEAKDRKAAEQVKPQEKKKSKLPLIAIIVVVIAGLGGGYYKLTQVPDGSELAKPFDQLIITDPAGRSKQSDNDKPKVNPLVKDTQTKQQPSSKDPVTPVSTAVVQKEALEKIVDLSRLRNNRSKPFSRRLAAEAYAITGNIEDSQGQIERIDAVKPLLPFYKIFPLIKIGWIQLKQKSGPELKKTLDQTIELSKQIPEFGGRDSLDLVARLAAFWVAAGKEDLAIDLVKKYQAENSLAQLSASLQIAHETNQYDFESLIDLHHRWDSPQWVATTLILIARGYPQEALNWAALAPDSMERTEAVTQWSLAQIEQSVKQKQKPEIAKIQPAEKKLSPTGNALMYARCARKLISLKQPEPARVFLTKSISFLSGTPVPTPVTLGNIKAISEMALPDAAPLDFLAQTYLQIACAESELGQTAEAVKFLNNSVQTIRAIAPSVAAVQTKNSEASNFNFRDQIKEALNLDSSDRLRRGINNYKKQLRNLKSAAENRQVLLVKLLSQATRSQLAAQAWKIAASSQQATNDNLKDTLLETSLPAVILESIDQKNNQLETQIKTALNQSMPDLSKEDTLIKQTTSLVMNGKPEQAAYEINQSDLKKAWKGQLSLQLLSSLMNQSKLKEAIQFTTAIKDPVLREDMLNTIGAVAAIQGNIAPVKQLLDSNRYTPTESISGYLGLISGIQATKKNDDASTSPSKEQPKNL
ncbi:hypothetical protein [uncultured Gimesia sp.]|uniref:hypothetical protein n=1 Tax=uncultured Gimesia sp. TaxID=1678688 RepID=UPI0030D970A1